MRNNELVIHSIRKAINAHKNYVDTQFAFIGFKNPIYIYLYKLAVIINMHDFKVNFGI